MNKNFFYIYILLWTVYELQGTLYAHGNIISVSALFIIIIMSLYLFFYSNIHYKLPTPLKILSILIIVWTVYGLEPILFGTGQTAFFVQPFSYLKGIFVSLLPIYAFYYFSKKGFLTEDILRWLFMLFLILAVFNFYDYKETVLASVEGDTEEVTNNAGYVVVSLLPLLPIFWRRPLWQYALLGICLFFVLLGMKRGAIIGGAICAIWMMWNSFRQDRNEGKNKRRKLFYIRVLATIVILSAVVYAVQYMLNTSDYFNLRLQETIEGNYSGREDMYGTYFNWFVNQNGVFKILFGNGANATLRFFSNYAHNDWLEILINNGLITSIIYAAYWISLIAMLVKGKRGSTTMLMLGCFVIIYLLKTMVSMSYNSTTVYAACAAGYALANYQFRVGGSK